MPEKHDELVMIRTAAIGALIPMVVVGLLGWVVLTQSHGQSLSRLTDDFDDLQIENKELLDRLGTLEKEVVSLRMIIQLDHPDIDLAALVLGKPSDEEVEAPRQVESQNGIPEPVVTPNDDAPNEPETSNERLEIPDRTATPAPNIAVSEDAERQRLLGITTFYFEFDKADLSAEARDALVVHAAELKANPSRRVRLEGHADERGTREYNLALGERRSQAVERYLQVQGVSTDQMEIISYGEEIPEESAFYNSQTLLTDRRFVGLEYLE